MGIMADEDIFPRLQAGRHKRLREALLRGGHRFETQGPTLERGPLLGSRPGSCSSGDKIPRNPQRLPVNQLIRRSLQVPLRGSPETHYDPAEPIDPTVIHKASPRYRFQGAMKSLTQRTPRPPTTAFQSSEVN